MQRITEFLDGAETFVYPAPGGALGTGAETSNADADYYVAEVAALIKRREMKRSEALDVLAMKIEQVRLQRHYGAREDALIIERMQEWMRDLSH